MQAAKNSQQLVAIQTAGHQKNFRQTVCRHWLRGLCMKGESCGFLHQFDPSRMPVCRYYAKYGECKEPDCVFKHSLDDIKDCNMYKLGFCIHGPLCRYKHTRMAGPPPPPETVECLQKPVRPNFVQSRGGGRGDSRHRSNPQRTGFPRDY
mmetsp:Transcript_6005/g.37281  ORF Transcript_6005/g.37281 Transcript_6005/m.37281 type:complete len:150 (+) Transcript_6005:311-760(+)